MPQVNGRYIRKRLHVRVEHVQPSRCREDFLRRREENDRIKHEAKERGGEGVWEGRGREGRNRSSSSSGTTTTTTTITSSSSRGDGRAGSK